MTERSGYVLETLRDASDGREPVVVASRRRRCPTVAIIETNNDITYRKQVEHAFRDSERRHRHIFQTAGVSIWEEDLSGPKAAIDDLKARGVRNFREHLGEHSESVRDAVSMVRIVYFGGDPW